MKMKLVILAVNLFAVCFVTGMDPMNLEDFEILQVVGKGAYGTVMQVKRKDTDEIYAMKALTKGYVLKRNQVKHTQTERKVASTVNSRYVSALRYAFQDDARLYLVSDFHNGGDLFGHLRRQGRFSEEHAKIYVTELVLAIEALHKAQVVYRDLKPENIIITNDGHVKLIDFGLCTMLHRELDETSIDLQQVEYNEELKKLGKERANSFVGTPEYLAPEIISHSGHRYSVDWWTLGCALYEMLTGVPPFYVADDATDRKWHMYKKISEEQIRYPRCVSDRARDLINGLLNKTVEKRLGANGVNEIKRMAFFEGIDWTALENGEVLTPPWTPETGSDYFDKEFTSMSTKLVPVPIDDFYRKAKDLFPEWDYNRPRRQKSGITVDLPKIYPLVQEWNNMGESREDSEETTPSAQDFVAEPESSDSSSFDLSQNFPALPPAMDAQYDDVRRRLMSTSAPEFAAFFAAGLLAYCLLRLLRSSQARDPKTNAEPRDSCAA